ncbi:unnamed protein product [Heligmosomoides polygyrus]|uniref:Peptidase A2 domain-containing protein n=1 Tax=Heligmosomoides polygyrus TaxID=6339 RepID=A0A183GXC7_HELPZ|nr:unnamed protein product [Heligmosomoides polygyrus]
MCDQQLDEEMLLRTPENTMATGIEESDKRPLVENRSARQHLGSEEVLKQMNKSMTMIVVECEKVVSQTLRTTDPTRNRIREVLDRQVKVAKETIKNVLEQAAVQQENHTSTKGVQTLEKDQDIGEEVVELLKIASLTQVEQLERYLDESMADREALRVLCEVASCEKAELEMKLREMKRNLESNEHDIVRLREYIDQQEIQVRELTEEMREMGRDKSQPLTSTSAASGNYLQDAASLAQWDPSVLIAIANKMLKEYNGKPVVFCGHRIPKSEEQKKSRRLFGPKSVRLVQMLDMEVKALLDTGSEMSIVPIWVLQQARKKNIDLDTYVTKIPRVEAVVRNASGEIMTFLDTICVPVTMCGSTQLVPFHVGDCVDELVILGTNALELFGIRLGPVDNEGMKKTEPEMVEAVIKERTFIPAHSSRVATLNADTGPGEYVLWSSSDTIEHGVCRVTADGSAAVTVWNPSDEARVLHKGEVVGEWAREEWTPLHAFDNGADMLEEGKRQLQENDKERVEELVTILKEKSQLPPPLEALIRECADTFAVRDSELTQTDLVEHEIDTGDSPPIRQKTRPVPMGARKEFKAIIQSLLERGIIARSNSEWASPVVLVRKKDGPLRLCIDYRAVNKATKQDSYPLPSIDTVIQSLGGKKIFSTLDLISGTGR